MTTNNHTTDPVYAGTQANVHRPAPHLTRHSINIRHPANTSIVGAQPSTPRRHQTGGAHPGLSRGERL